MVPNSPQAALHSRTCSTGIFLHSPLPITAYMNPPPLVVPATSDPVLQLLPLPPSLVSNLLQLPHISLTLCFTRNLFLPFFFTRVLPSTVLLPLSYSASHLQLLCPSFTHVLPFAAPRFPLTSCPALYQPNRPISLCSNGPGMDPMHYHLELGLINPDYRLLIWPKQF